jgi:hypothetical protein
MAFTFGGTTTPFGAKPAFGAQSATTSTFGMFFSLKLI